MIIQSRYRVDLMETIQPTSMHTMMIQGDAEANRILLEVYQGGLPYDLTGSGCVATVIRADAAEVPITGAVAGNAMYIDLPQEAYACEGRIIIIMRVVQGQAEASLFYGIGTVLFGEAGTVINPGGRIPNLAELLMELDEMAAATAAANAAAEKAVRYDDTQLLTSAEMLQARKNIHAASIFSLAIMFAADLPYYKGDLVHREGILYYFTDDHPAGPWTGTDVYQTNIAEVLRNRAVRSDIPQSLTDAEKAQARQNIGAVSHSDLESMPQILDTDAAAADLDLTDEDGYVLARFQGGGIQTKYFDSASALFEIGELQGDVSELQDDVDALQTDAAQAVRFTPQTIAAAGKAQARQNIDAISYLDFDADDSNSGFTIVYG